MRAQFISYDKDQFPVLVAAAGRASRCMGEKLDREYRGRPLLSWLLQRLCDHPRIEEVIVLTGHRHVEVEKLVVPFQLARCLFNPKWADGLSSTLKAGVAALPENSSFLMALGDTPLFQASTVDAVLPKNLAQSTRIRRPSYFSQGGHPVYFPAWTRPDWDKLQGDSGAKQLFELWRDRTVSVPVDDPGILRDFDTLADFESNQNHSGTDSVR